MNNSLRLVITILTFLLASILSAQDTPEFKYKIGGTIQAWTSMGEINGADTNSIGWGLRRVRLKAYSSFGDKMKGFFQMELTSATLMDARIDYLITKDLTIRAGRFIGAGVRAAGLTSHTKIDITERAYSAIMWGKETIGSDYRDYGIDGVYSFDDFKATLTLHNGDGKTNILNKQTGAGAKNGSFAISGMASFSPKSIKGLEVGGYYGMGNPEINDFNAYNGYIYYEPMPFRMKAEIIGWKNTINDEDTNKLGFYIFAGYRFAENWEVAARFEKYDPSSELSDDHITLLTGGLTYSVFSSDWAAGKISVAYTYQKEADVVVYPEIDNNVFQTMMQLAF